MRFLYLCAMLCAYSKPATYIKQDTHIQRLDKNEIPEQDHRTNQVILMGYLEDFCEANNLTLTDAMKKIMIQRCCVNYNQLIQQEDVLRSMLILRLAVSKHCKELGTAIVPEIKKFLDNPMQKFSQKLQQKITYNEAQNTLNRLVSQVIVQVLHKGQYIDVDTKIMRPMAFWIGSSDMMKLSALKSKYIKSFKAFEEYVMVYDEKTKTFNKKFTGDLKDLMKNISIVLDDLLIIWIIEALPEECKLLALKILHVARPYEDIVQLLGDIIKKAIYQNVYNMNGNQYQIIEQNFYQSKYLLIHNARII